MDVGAMEADANPDRLVARADRLDAFAARLADDLDSYVRREARRHRDEYPRAGVSVETRDPAGPDALAYSVEILSIQPAEDGEGTRRVTFDVTAAITETEGFERRHRRHRAARRDAERFRELSSTATERVTDASSSAENAPGNPRQSTIGEYLD